MKSEIHSKKWNSRGDKFSLHFPSLSINEEDIIRSYCKSHKYQCIIDKNTNKAIVRNPVNNKIGYIQKQHGDIRLVFNNRFESLSLAIITDKIIGSLSKSFELKGEMKSFFNRLSSSYELMS